MDPKRQFAEVFPDKQIVTPLVAQSYYTELSPKRLLVEQLRKQIEQASQNGKQKSGGRSVCCSRTVSLRSTPPTLSRGPLPLTVPRVAWVLEQAHTRAWEPDSVMPGPTDSVMPGLTGHLVLRPAFANRVSVTSQKVESHPPLGCDLPSEFVSLIGRQQHIVRTHVFRIFIDGILSYILAREDRLGKINFYSITEIDITKK